MRELFGNLPRRTKDSRADRVADDYRQPKPYPEHAQQVSSRLGYWRSCLRGFQVLLPVNVECLGPLSFSPGFSRVYY